MRILRTTFAFALFALTASAGPILWTLNNVTSLGTRITGSFVFNADTDTYSYIEISTSGGSVIPTTSWSSVASCCSSGTLASQVLALVDTTAANETGANTLSLGYYLTTTGGTGLTDAGGSRAIIDTGQGICAESNCDSWSAYSNAPGQGFNSSTTGSVVSTATFLLQGGFSSTPVPLPNGQPVGYVTGTIGGLGSEDYYTFLWAGGAFNTTASITGANTGASYLFSEGVAGTCSGGGTATLNSSDSFSGTIAIASLASGTYCIGIDANNSNDPAFALVFNTPVEGTVTPEPSTVLLLTVGLGIISVLRLKRTLAAKHS